MLFLMYIVTGANGFIGSAMVWELNQKGIEDIICVDTVSLDARPENLKGGRFKKIIHTEDLWDFLPAAHINQPIKAVFHMGACSTTTEMNREFLRQNNTLYTQKIFEWCRNNQVPLIYASSAATYGAGELGFSDQIDPEKLLPLNPYGESKLNFDRWVLKNGKSASPWYGLRFFNVFGPNEFHKDSMSSLVFKAFHQIQKNNELGLFKSYRPEYADGEQLRDFVYVKDVTRWMWELLQEKPLSGIYNMGFGKAHSWIDLAQGTFKALEKPMKIHWLEMPENIKNQYQYFTEADMNHWKNQGLSEPHWPLETAIADYVKNYLIPNINIFNSPILS